MRTARLVQARFLDPRSAGAAARRPIRDAVNIPFTELPRRVHELPPRAESVAVVGPDDAAQPAVAWLTGHGRAAAQAAEWEYAQPTECSDVRRLWRPNAWLADVVPRLTPGRALELACGTGRDAVFLASCGWDVTAVDVLPDALERARVLATRCAPAIEPISWQQADLEHGTPAWSTPFDLIVSIRYLHRPLLPRLAAWARPGGSFVLETFTTTHRARHGRPAADAHVLQPGELRARLADWQIVEYSEDWRGDVHTARVWARRVAANQ
jgi:SAM-dependent methyltransferase